MKKHTEWNFNNTKCIKSAWIQIGAGGTKPPQILKFPRKSNTHIYYTEIDKIFLIYIVHTLKYVINE